MLIVPFPVRDPASNFTMFCLVDLIFYYKRPFFQPLRSNCSRRKRENVAIAKTPGGRESERGEMFEKKKDEKKINS